jgi:hypothetical protein
LMCPILQIYFVQWMVMLKGQNQWGIINFQLSCLGHVSYLVWLVIKHYMLSWIIDTVEGQWNSCERRYHMYQKLLGSLSNSYFRFFYYLQLPNSNINKIVIFKSFTLNEMLWCKCMFIIWSNNHFFFSWCKK